MFIEYFSLLINDFNWNDVFFDTKLKDFINVKLLYIVPIPILNLEFYDGNS